MLLNSLFGIKSNYLFIAFTQVTSPPSYNLPSNQLLVLCIVESV